MENAINVNKKEQNMHNLLNLYNYKTKRIFSKYGEKSENKVVKYRMDFDLSVENFKAFYKQRVLSKLINASNTEFKNIVYTLGLSKYSKYSDVAIKTSDFLAEQTVRAIYTMSRFQNANELKQYLKTNELEMPSIMLDMTRFINCNYRIRPIVNSNSVLYCEKLKVKNNLSEKESENLEFLKSDLINVNQIMRIIKLDQITTVSDFEELYNSNDYDFSVSTQSTDKGKQVKVIVGDNCEDSHTIAALLMRPHIHSAENLKQNSYEEEINNSDAREILRTGNVAFNEYQNYNEITQDFVISEVNSKLTGFGNTEIKKKEIKGKISKIKSELIEDIDNEPKNDESPNGGGDDQSNGSDEGDV